MKFSKVLSISTECNNLPKYIPSMKIALQTIPINSKRNTRELLSSIGIKKIGLQAVNIAVKRQNAPVLIFRHPIANIPTI